MHDAILAQIEKDEEGDVGGPAHPNVPKKKKKIVNIQCQYILLFCRIIKCICFVFMV